MIVKSLTLALVASAVAAAPGRARAQRNRPQAAKDDAAREFTAEDDARFGEYAAKMGKNYTSRDQFKRKERKWKEADDYIKKKNAMNKDKPNGMKLKHNELSDLDDEEYMQLLGLSNDPEERSKANKSLTKGAKKDEHKGRKLQGTGVDHSKLGHMTPVKNQGSCGSCWAFTATSVLEGTITALDDTKSPVRLSEQQLVDCNKYDATAVNQPVYNRNQGCSGGWMTYAWYYQM